MYIVVVRQYKILKVYSSNSSNRDVRITALGSFCFL